MFIGALGATGSVLRSVFTGVGAGVGSGVGATVEVITGFSSRLCALTTPASASLSEGVIVSRAWWLRWLRLTCFWAFALRPRFPAECFLAHTTWGAVMVAIRTR